MPRHPPRISAISCSVSPAALENTCAALSAGSTVIGNLGQYFTFRLPDWQDDIESTRATLAAIGLMAAQPVTVMVHSNLDDGFAAVFEDLACALGAVLLEKYIVEELAGGTITHCFGHHYTTPKLRMAFQRALVRTNPNPGSMIYGNTTAYRGNAAENYAGLGGYLVSDIAAQASLPGGHAINPVPVTENRRIPEIVEIIDAQCFAHRLSADAKGHTDIVDWGEIDRLANRLERSARRFFRNTLKGLDEAGFDTRDAFEMLLAVRRIGGRELELRYGPGQLAPGTNRRTPLVRSDTVRELDDLVRNHLSEVDKNDREAIQRSATTVLSASTDVHEHGKHLAEGILCGLGVTLVDGGISAQPEELGRQAESCGCDVVMLSTYNGVALSFYSRLSDELAERGVEVPVIIGGQLNEVPDDSVDSLPVDVSDKLAEAGALPCRSIPEIVPQLLAILSRRG